MTNGWSGPVPTEIAKRLVNPGGMVFLIRAKMRGAELSPFATVSTRNGRFVAEFHFEKPIGPECQSAVVVQLGVMPEARP